MVYKDYYDVLGVPRDANLDQIKKAYRKLARENHPDVSKAKGGEARFKEVAEAYATLKDPEKRKAFDELGRRPAGEEFAPPPQWEQHFGKREGGFGDIDLEELLSSLGRGRPGAQRAARPGARTLEVTIPPGVSDGQKLRLKGKGGPGRNGGEAGDIYLHLTLAPHPVFRADRQDLYFDLALAPWEAALGAELEVPTLDGPVVLTVPPGTRSGRKLRLRGRGLGREQRGDLYAVAVIDVPGTVSDAERDLYRQLATVSNFNPRGGGTGGQHGNAKP
jgi:curved DNA-binding protein